MACCKSNSPYLSIILSGIAVIIAGVAITNARDQGADAKSFSASYEHDPAYVLDFEMDRINGITESLETYKGDVILLVNVASACGLTPQYEGLEALYREKKDDGFVILAFPANNFGGQEPGTDEQIAEFCTGRFDVTFPMFSKISVVGDDVHPLYQRIDDQPDPIGEPPNWNFTKYLVDRGGNVIARFPPQTEPDNEALLLAIDTALTQSPDE